MTLEQHSRWLGTHKFQLTDTEIITELCHRGGVRNHRERLSFINPHPLRERQSMRGWIAPSLIYGTLMLGAFALGIWTIVTDDRPDSLPTGLMLCFVGLCFLSVWGWKLFQATKTRYDILAYFHKVTGQPVVTLLFNKPSIKAFGIFRAELDSRLTISLPSDDGSGLISSELESLAKLRDKGVLTLEEFQEAKTDLLTKIKQSRSIGFR